MMKKLINGLRKAGAILWVLTLLAYQPLNAYAKEAETLADLREELKSLQAEKKRNEQSKNQTQSEINSKKNAVANAHEEIEQAKTDITIAEQEITDSKTEIDKLTAETEALLVFMQQMNGENAYVQYVTGSSSMTELVMRLAAVDQITTYNQKTLAELEALINKNEQLKVELEQKQVDLNNKIESYEKKITSLGKNLADLAEVSEDIDDQIKNQKALIKTYEDMGCGENQLLSQCVEVANNASWRKPLKRGVVTSLWGYRKSPITGAQQFHNGIDLAGNSEGTKIYSAASGTVAAITWKSSCGGNKVYIHSYVNGKSYTHYYFHLLNINVKVGDNVTTETAIGTVGGGSKTRSYDKCSTGAHLHFGIATGFYLGAGKGSYSSYSKLVANNIQPPGFGKKGSWFYSR